METGDEGCDETDRRILRILQAEGDIANNLLAEQVGLTPGPCSRRVARLRARGVIRRHTVVIDPVALGYTLSAFVEITLDRNVNDVGRRFAETMRRRNHLRDIVVRVDDFPFDYNVATANKPAECRMAA